MTGGTNDRDRSSGEPVCFTAQCGVEKAHRGTCLRLNERSIGGKTRWVILVVLLCVSGLFWADVIRGKDPSLFLAALSGAELIIWWCYYELNGILFCGKRRIGKEIVEIGAEEICIRSGDNVTSLPLTALQYVDESEELLLLSADRSSVVLEKTALTGGTAEELLLFLQTRTGITPRSFDAAVDMKLGWLKLFIAVVITGVIYASTLYCCVYMPHIHDYEGISLPMQGRFKVNSGSEAADLELDNYHVSIYAERYIGYSNILNLRDFAALIMGGSCEITEDDSGKVYVRSERDGYDYLDVFIADGDTYWNVEYAVLHQEAEEYMPRFARWARGIRVGEGK